MNRVIIVACTLLTAGFAYAGAGNQQAEYADTGLSDLINVCQRLERNPQIKDFSSEVICRGHRTFWQEKDVVDLPMDTEHYVRSEIIMKGSRYQVNELVSQMTSEPESAKCNVYEELRVEYSPISVRLNSCADLQELADLGREAFCADHLTEAQLLMSEGKATGRTFNTCR